MGGLGSGRRKDVTQARERAMDVLRRCPTATADQIGKKLGIPRKRVYYLLGTAYRDARAIRRSAVATKKAEWAKRIIQDLREHPNIKLRHIGERLGVTRQRAHQLLNGAYQEYLAKKEDVDAGKIHDCLNSGQTCIETAKELGMSINRVQRIARKNSWSRARFDHEIGRLNNGAKQIMLADGRTVLRSRYVMEKHLGRPLTKQERIVHRNGNSLDDRVCNLRVCASRGEATTAINRRRKRSGLGWGQQKRDGKG
jgi:DNA-directed RNA polymerase sigma subunit (sigma70/sigma32)